MDWGRVAGIRAADSAGANAVKLETYAARQSLISVLILAPGG
jgi:hypothetical protein